MGRSPWRRERVQGLAPIRRARQLRAVMRIHLVDGTYELFRAYYGAPKATAPDGSEVGATRGLLRSLLSLLREDGVTHVACAFDHVIESFRNDLFAGYKTGEGVEADLLAQFPLAERAVHALGLVVWPMVEFETDDALATAAARADAEPGVEQVIICSPDKDLTQCVRGTRVVCLDRLRRRIYDEAAVREKFGVTGVPRWGARSASTVLARYPHLELIPDRETEWEVTVRGAAALASSLREHREDAVLYRRLTTLRVDVPLQEAPRDLRWEGADRDALTALCRAIGDDELLSRVSRWR
jgi:5'-3' exonuclease